MLRLGLLATAALVAALAVAADSITISGSGWLTLTSIASGQVLDVPGASATQGTQLEQWTANGTVVIQWPYHNGGNEHWIFVSVGGGFYEIVNQNSGKALEEPANGGSNQQWTLSIA